jgi:hypothetical protein
MVILSHPFLGLSDRLPLPVLPGGLLWNPRNRPGAFLVLLLCIKLLGIRGLAVARKQQLRGTKVSWLILTPPCATNCFRHLY